MSLQGASNGLARKSWLITGGAGFIGSHLADRLLADGHEVTVLDDLSTGTLSNLCGARVSDRFSFVEGSVMDEALVNQLVRRTDVVLHLAAAVGVEVVMGEPLKSFLTNTRGTEVVLAAAHRSGRQVVVASTSEIYGKNDGGALGEASDLVLGPPSVTRWGYATSKMVDEFLAFQYHRELGLPVVVTRFFNTVGPRQSPLYGMVIPRMVHQALTGQPITVYGDGNQTRCFCHVSDTVEAVLRLVDCEAALGEAFNVGSSIEVSMLELADAIRERSGSASEVVLVPYEVAFPQGGFEDMRRRVPDTVKIQRLVGWAPRRNLDVILTETITATRTELRSLGFGPE